MALKVYDGFDHYNTVTDLLSRSGFLQWQITSSSTPGIAFVPGLVGGQGKALQLTMGGNNNENIFGVFSDRNQEAFVGVRLYLPTSGSNASGVKLGFADTVGGLCQCMVHFNQANYSIAVYRGDIFSAGVLLGVTANNVWSANSAFYADIRMKIDNSAGEVQIKINGVTVLNLSGLDNQVSANAWFDAFQIKVSPDQNVNLNSMILDDVRYNDTTTGPGPNPYDSFMGDMRCVGSFAIGDDVVQFTPEITTRTFGNTNTDNSVGNAPNVIGFMPFTIPNAGDLDTTLTVTLTGAVSGHLVLGIYDSDGVDNLPGTKLVQATALTNPVSGVNTFTFTGSPALVTNRTYYLALLADATVGYRSDNIFAGTLPWFSLALPYTGNLPANVLTSSFNTYLSRTITFAGLIINISNFGNVSEVAMDSNVSYNIDAVLNDEDLLNFAALPLLIDMIAAIQLTFCARKDEAGDRALAASLKVGGAHVYGSDKHLGTSYQYYTELWELNPDTSSPWDVSSVNGLSGGYKITL